MSGLWWIIVAVVGVLAAVAFFFYCRYRPKSADLERCRLRFRRQREHLEARFMTLAARSGKPRGLEWVDCQFDDEITLAHQRSAGRLCALVGVTIRFEAVEGGDMEDNPNVGNLRAATAVFYYDGTRWSTEGRAIFNLNPVQTVRHFQGELEIVEGEERAGTDS